MAKQLDPRLSGKGIRRDKVKKEIRIDSDKVELTPESQRHYEHMRKCHDCVDAVLDWSRPMFYAQGKPGGRVRTDMDGFLALARQNQDLIDGQVRFYVVMNQTTGGVPDWRHTADEIGFGK